MPDISIVIPAYQAAGTVGACVRALCQQSVDRARYEIIVIDDASTDNTLEAAREAGADIVQTIAHGGASGARNAGVARSSGELILFIDSDCEANPHWVAQMIKPFDNPAVMGGKGVYRTRQTSLIAKLVQLEFEIRYERMVGVQCIDFVDTYSAAYRRDLFESLGGFNTNLIAGEDVALSFRYTEAGHCLVFIPEAWVYHTHPQTLFKYLQRKARFGFWRGAVYLRFPDKIHGDNHTDPALKSQFVLTALSGLFLALALFVPYVWILAIFMLLAYTYTTLKFVRWAWSRNRSVALIWPAVNYLRVWAQGAGLAFGLAYHALRRKI